METIKDISFPLITCVVATHNRRNLVGRAVNSIIRQTYKYWELIVVVDGCRDDTEEYLRKDFAGNPRIRIVVNKSALGAARSRNKGIDDASGEFISFLDDDDVWLPQKLERQVAHAIKGYDFVTCSRAICIVNGKSSVYGSRIRKVSLPRIFIRNQIISVSPLVRTSLMRRIYFDPAMPPVEDYDAWIRILKEGVRTINLNDPLILYHRTPLKSLNRSRQQKLSGRKIFYRKHRNIMPILNRSIFLILTGIKYLVPDPRYYILGFRHKLRKGSC